MAVNDSCRLCDTNLRVGGSLSNTKLLFDRKEASNVASQLSMLGFVIDNTPLRSYRVCRKCCFTISRLLRDNEVLQKWKEKEMAMVVGICLEKDDTFSNKRDRELTPSKTQRAVLKFRTSADLPVPTSTCSLTEKRTPAATVLTASDVDPKINAAQNVQIITDSGDEEIDFCDQDSLASSVDSIAEEMFIDAIDPILDCRNLSDLYPPEEDCDSKGSKHLSELYPPEEDCDSEDGPQQRKKARLCSTAEGDARDGENEISGVSIERWHSSDEEDVRPCGLLFTPAQRPGPQSLPNSCTSPLQFLQLLFPKTMFQTIADHTNGYGFKCEEKYGKAWSRITQNDIKSFIALIIYMGMFKCSSLTDYWSASHYFSLPFPPKVMSYQKFLSISQALHLSNSKEDEKNSYKRGKADHERLAKIQPLYQTFREACKTFFHPHQKIAIIERMVASQAATGLKRCQTNQYPDMGYKLFALTDCTSGYTWDFFIYEGKSCASQSEGLSYESVMALVDENMLGFGYKLYVDKFYTSPTLFKDLLDKKIIACGPVWPNRAGFPKTTVNKLSKIDPRGTMRWIRDDELLFVEWKDSRDVRMCSSFHKAYEGDTVQRKVVGDAHRTLVEVPIPAVTLDYKKSMEAVDPLNCATGHYRTLKKTKKWYQNVFYHFLDIGVENAFIMQQLMAKAKNKKPLTRKTFLELLILELADTSGCQDSGPGPLAPSAPSDSSASAPSDFSVLAPSDFPASAPSDFPASAPSDFSASAPSDFSASAPSDFSASAPLDFSASALSDSSTSAPSACSKTSSKVHFGYHKPKHVSPDDTGKMKCDFCRERTQVMCETCDVMLCFQPERECFNYWHEMHGLN